MSTVGGRNYLIEISSELVAVARVRRRPDLDTGAGADDAAEMCDRLLELDERRALAGVLDLTDAPAVTGPRTAATLANLVRRWTATRRRFVIVVGASAMQRMQMVRLIDEIGSPLARVEGSLAAARAWTSGTSS
jgi:hypothetical protein